MFMQQNNKKGTRLVKTCKCGDEPIKLKKKKKWSESTGNKCQLRTMCLMTKTQEETQSNLQVTSKNVL